MLYSDAPSSLVSSESDGLVEVPDELEVLLSCVVWLELEVLLPCVVWLELEVLLPCVVWLEAGGSIGSQLSSSVMSTILFQVALVNVSVPLEDNPPALGVQYFTVCHFSVTVMLPVWPGGQLLVRVWVHSLITSSGGAV